MRKLRFWVAAAALGIAGSVLAQSTPSPAPTEPPRPSVPVARVEPVDLNAPAAAHHARKTKAKHVAHKPAPKPARHAKHRKP